MTIANERFLKLLINEEVMKRALYGAWQQGYTRCYSEVYGEPSLDFNDWYHVNYEYEFEPAGRKK